MRARRMFAADPPRITFTRDFRQNVHGDVLPGREVTIVYDAERLPRERSTAGGRTAWRIACYFKFVETGPAHAVDLWSETGEILTKITAEPGEGTMMVGRIAIPFDADHLTIWFLNTGASGEQYWDSNFGRNYIFRFVVEDVDIVRVGVEPAPNEALSRFHIDVSASPEVDALVVLYHIMNGSDAERRHDTALPMSRASEPGDHGRWHWTASAPVPLGAVVRFTLSYSAYGYVHTESNNRRGYLTWAGSTPDREAGVL